MKQPHPSQNFDSRLPCQKLFDLTPGEWKVLLCIADDLMTAEIAEKLCLTPKSVENYRTRISAKLGLQGHHKLVQFARKQAIELRQWHEEALRKLPPPPLKIK